MTFTIGRAALATVLTVASIGGVFAAGQEDAAAGSEPARISYMIFDNGRYATTLEDHIILRELGKRFNVDWDMQPVPSSDAPGAHYHAVRRRHDSTCGSALWGCWTPSGRSSFRRQ